MRLVKVAASTLNQTPLDWERNRQNILSVIARAKAERVSILCLPELCISGYGCEDMFLSPAVLDMALEVLGEILPHTAGLILSVGLPLRYNKAVFNACALIDDGKLL